MIVRRLVLWVFLLLTANQALAAGFCSDFQRRLIGIAPAVCQRADLKASDAKSVRGRPLYLTDVRGGEPRLRALVIGGIHGDELSSTALALKWIELARVTPAQTEWRFVPALNPDGLLTQPGRRTNANGVDLNRNFPTKNWASEAPVYWEQRTRRDPRRWPGRSPLSEPETQFLMRQVDDFRPDLIVSIHAPYGVLDFDGPTIPPSRLGRLYLDRVGIFPGSLGHFAGVDRNIPVVTIELSHHLRAPVDAEVRQMWLDLQRWISERGMERLSGFQSS